MSWAYWRTYSRVPGPCIIYAATPRYECTIYLYFITVQIYQVCWWNAEKRFVLSRTSVDLTLIWQFHLSWTKNFKVTHLLNLTSDLMAVQWRQKRVIEQTMLFSLTMWLGWCKSITNGMWLRCLIWTGWGGPTLSGQLSNQTGHSEEVLSPWLTKLLV